MIALRMSKPITVVLLGADRVGKSTIVNNTIKKLEMDGYDVMSLHFSGPQPHHSSPIQQYIEPFDMAREAYPQVIVCDRGFAEVAFYDKFRRHIDISHEWAQSAESYFLEKSLDVRVYIVKRDWEWSQPHHVTEILEQNPDATAWWVKNQLAMRRREHEAYYDYMFQYLNNYSLLPHTVLESPSKDHDVSDCTSAV
jgi:GTPase SAR1 family protein